MTPTKVYIKENSWMAKIATKKLHSDSVAMVVGSKIHLYNVSKQQFLKDKEWLCHELAHIEQYKRHGRFVFLIKYLFYSIKYGYKNNPFEKEARAREKDYQLLEKYIIC
jgi:hypothetical protein